MGSIGIGDGELIPESPESLKQQPNSFKRNKSRGVSSVNMDEIVSLLHGSDPVRLELNRLQNQLRDKDRELGDAYAEIKGLKQSERLKEKAVEELNDELNKVDEKLKTTEALLDSKILEIKRIYNEKKEALAAQHAAEATLRRVHAAQKDDEMPPIEAIIAPLEAEIKLARTEVSKLQEDNRTLDRLTRSKEAALLEAEKTVEMALAKASLVDDLQNKNQELMKQIEICQEENRILDKMNRQKVAEVEKLTQTVHELEEAVLAGGAAANAVRDYQRKVKEMNEEKKILERELARAKISANRVAVVVANEWKDTDDKVMPVRQWLEERRQFQGEMQQLRDKLAISQRTAKTEAQLKEKYQLRFKVLEERLKSSCNGFSHIAQERKAFRNGQSRRMSLGGAENLYMSPSNGFSARNLPSQPFHANGASPMLKHADTSSSSSEDSSRLIDVDTSPPSGSNKDGRPSHVNEDAKSNGISKIFNRNREGDAENIETECDDFVSGMLYDMLQKEVLTLRKSCRQKDQSLKDKDDAIEILRKNVETLNRAMEVESKRMRREVAVMEKEVATMRTVKERDQRARCPSASRTALVGRQSPSVSARNARKL